MKALILLFLCITSVRLDSDICQFLRSSDSSLAIGLYHRMTGNLLNRTDSYYLFRRDERSSTRMWEMTFRRDLSEEIDIRLTEQSLESIGENTTQAFSVSDDKQVFWNCSVVKKWANDWQTLFHFIECQLSNKTIRNDDKNQLIKGNLIFNAKPSNSSSLIVFDKDVHTYQTLEIRSDAIQIGTKKPCDSDKCTEFLPKMKTTSLLDRLEAIVDFKVDNSSGHLLLFNINGEPKFCIQSYPSNNRSKCNSETDLRSLADQCFRNDTNGGSAVWLILGVVLAVMLVLGGISLVIWIWIRQRGVRKKTLTDTTTFTSGRDSQTPPDSTDAPIEPNKTEKKDQKFHKSSSDPDLQQHKAPPMRLVVSEGEIPGPDSYPIVDPPVDSHK